MNRYLTFAVLLSILLIYGNRSYGQRGLFAKKEVISTPIHGDVFIRGGNITINAPVRGNVVITGGSVKINDSVTYNVYVLGGRLICKGYVGGDIRVADGELFLLDGIGCDLIIAGGLTHISKGISIGGALLAGEGKIDLHGTITVKGKSMNLQTPLQDIVTPAGNFKEPCLYKVAY